MVTPQRAPLEEEPGVGSGRGGTGDPDPIFRNLYAAPPRRRWSYRGAWAGTFARHSLAFSGLPQAS
jgi:hypothetical protein